MTRGRAYYPARCSLAAERLLDAIEVLDTLASELEYYGAAAAPAWLHHQVETADLVCRVRAAAVIAGPASISHTFQPQRSVA